MGSVGKRPSSGVYSDVDSKSTPMSDEDREQVGGGDWSSRYFQTAHAFRLNDRLRYAAESGDANAEIYNDPTVLAMDRNMQPLNKDMDITRMAGRSYIDTLLTATGAPEDFRMHIQEACYGFERFTQSDADRINSLLSGGTVRENAFMSTTYNKSLSDSAFSDRPIRIDLTAKAGTKGLFSPTGEESEFVIARTGGYVITHVSVGSGGRQLIFNGYTVN